MKTAIKYVENKSGDLNGRGRICRVSYSKSGRTLYYKDKVFRPVRWGYKFNHIEQCSGDEYWISGPKQRGGDRLYGQGGVEIDEDVRVEYWTNIRKQPERISETSA